MGHLTDGTLLGSYVTNHQIIGAGGFTTGGGIADDGTLAIHNDTAGPYIRKPTDTEGTQALRTGDTYIGSTAGLVAENCFALAIAPSDSDVVGFVVSGFLFRTADGGATVEKTALPQMAHENGAYADANQHAGRGIKMAIDPANPNVWYLQGEDGLLVSDDMFATWTEVDTADVPNPALRERYAILFDRHSTVSGGKTQGIYVHVPGTGLLHSTNAGTDWTLISAGPTAGCTGAVDTATGYVHLCQYMTDGNYYRWNGTTWHTVDIDQGVSVALDPNNAGHIYVANSGSFITTSLDDGDTFESAEVTATSMIRRAANIFWHAWANEVYMSHARMFFDPRAGFDRVWLFEGIGVWYADSPPEIVSNTTPITWNEHSVGIENMSGGTLLITPDGTLGYSCQDRCGFAISKADLGNRYPSTYAPGSPVDMGHALKRGQGMDYAPEDLSFIFSTSEVYGPDFGGYSTNRGRNWTRFEGSVSHTAAGEWAQFVGAVSGTTLTVTEMISGTIEVGKVFDWTDQTNLDNLSITALGTGTGGVGTYTISASRTVSSMTMNLVDAGGQRGGGMIIALSKDVLIQAQLNNGKLMYTVDRGVTWQDFVLGSGIQTFCSHNAFYLYRKVLVKDRYNANTAFFYNINNNAGDAADLASRGVWKIVYNPGTQTFTNTRVYTGYIDSWGADFWSGKLVQYDDGHWLWTAGDGSNNVFESQDDMVSWSIVTGTDNINGNFGGTAGFFGFAYGVAVGKGALAGDPKTVMVVGHRPPAYANPGNHDYYGYWLCRNFTDPDEDREWVRIEKFPGGNYGQYYGNVIDVVGCPVEYGTFYVANGGNGVFMLKLTDQRRASAGAAPTPTFTSIYSASGGDSNINVNCIAGRTYIVASSNSTQLVVDGSTTGVTSQTTPGFTIYAYTADVTETKVFYAGSVISIIEATGVTGFNGSNTGFAGDYRSGATDAPGALTGALSLAFCYSDGGGGVTASNMTAAGSTAPFYALAYVGGITPNVTWGGWTIMAAVGLT